MATRTIVSCDGCGKVLKDSDLIYGSSEYRKQEGGPYMTVDITLHNVAHYGENNKHVCVTACCFNCLKKRLKELLSFDCGLRACLKLEEKG